MFGVLSYRLFWLLTSALCYGNKVSLDFDRPSFKNRFSFLKPEGQLSISRQQSSWSWCWTCWLHQTWNNQDGVSGADSDRQRVRYHTTVSLFFHYLYPICVYVLPVCFWPVLTMTKQMSQVCNTVAGLRMLHQKEKYKKREHAHYAMTKPSLSPLSII